MKRKVKPIPLIQGLFYLLTAVWPLIHLESFLWVTGDKTDLWLVKTVAVLLIPYSFLFLWFACNDIQIQIVHMVAVACCVLLAFIEIYYYANGTIKWVYLADAVLELVFACWWVYDWNRRIKG